MKNKSKVLLMLPGALDAMESRVNVTEKEATAFLTGGKTVLNRETWTRTIGNTAIIDVTGPLLNNLSLVEMIMGYNSYSWILEDIKRAIADESVKNIVLDFDSPGGAASEMFEMAKYIKSLSAQKPIYAWIGSMACSAAYGLASACKKIYANPAAEIGSVGTMLVVAHQETPDQEGNKYIQIVATDSPLKNADPTTPEGMQSHVARLDALTNQFIEMLAANRGVTTDFVKSSFGKGAVFSGREAVDRNMIDGVYGTFDEFITTITNQGGKSMPTANADEKANVVATEQPESVAVETAEPVAEEQPTEPVKPNASAVEQPMPAATDAVSVAINDERARVAALSDIAVAANVSADVLAKAIQAGVTADEFRKDLIAAKETTDAINTRSVQADTMSYSERVKSKVSNNKRG